MATHWPKRIRKTGEKRKTCSRWLFIILLEFIFSKSCLGQNSMTAQIYTPVELSSQTLSGANHSESFTAISTVHCALHALKRDWVFLMCYEGNMCGLYNLPVQAKTYQREGSYGKHCYTRLDKECVHNGDVISEPEKQLALMIVKCEDGVHTLVPNPTALAADFYKYQPVSRPVYLSISRMVNWEEAKNLCKEYALELFIPIDVDDFDDFRTVLTTNFAGGDYWVGERDGLWIDGKALSPVMVHPTSFFTSNQDCGKVSNLNEFMVETVDCSANNGFICH